MTITIYQIPQLGKGAGIRYQKLCGKTEHRTGERFLSGPLPSVVVHPIVGHGVGQQKSAKISLPKKLPKQEKSPRNQPVSERFWSC